MYAITLVVTGTLGWFGYQLALSLLFVANLPLDWISLAFMLWNFTLLGLLAIFWQAPRILKQGYTVVMCSLMAFNLSFLPSLVSWILLGLLAIWGTN